MAKQCYIQSPNVKMLVQTHDAYELAPFVHNLTSNFNVTYNELKSRQYRYN